MKNLILILLLFICIACSSKSRSKSFWSAFFNNDEYSETFLKWTKQDRIMNEFDMTAIADVTYWNQDVREAYVEAVTMDYHLSEDEARSLAMEELSENESFDTFIVSLTTRQYGWSNLGSKDRLWTLILEDAESDARASPKSVDKIATKDERSKQYFKKMNRFSETFKVRFPKEDLKSAQKLVLHIRGPLGAMLFNFDRPQPQSIPTAP